jgi:hypothetical protein
VKITIEIEVDDRSGTIIRVDQPVKHALSFASGFISEVAPAVKAGRGEVRSVDRDSCRLLGINGMLISIERS